MYRWIACAPALLLGASDPRYTADGGLVPFGDYRQWVFLSSGVDMSYSERAAPTGHAMFDNVFVEPSAWAGFKQTAHWPDKAVFVLENRVGTSHGSINQRGQFQTGEVGAGSACA